MLIREAGLTILVKLNFGYGATILAYLMTSTIIISIELLYEMVTYYTTA